MKKILLLMTLLATFQLTFAQRVPVSVTVTDETGSGLPGANVLVKGTTDGGITDANGKLTINATPDAVLQISSIGYSTKEITVGNQTAISHQMVLDVTQLSEVVVTGYATEQKKDIVGSVSVVNTAQLLSTPAGSVTQQLQGRSPGVTVSGDGTPGGGAKVRVRGFGSFNNSDPLYIIDGVPTTNANNLNPNDVESMQVLKDAASASIYGSRGANGVIIITTKQGKKGTGAKVTFDAYYGENYFSKNNYPDLLNAKEYGEMTFALLNGAHTTLLGSSNPADVAKAVNYTPGSVGQPNSQWSTLQYGNGATPVIPEYIFVNDNGTKYGGTQLEQLKASANPADVTLYNSLVNPANYNFQTHQIVRSADTDWFKEAFKPASQQNYQLGVSGGSDAGNYALSLNIFDQNNTSSPLAFYKRYTLRSNSTFKVGNKIRIGENVQLGYNSQLAGANTAQVWTMTSMIPVYDIMGNPASSAAPGLVAVGDTGRNPITEVWRSRFNKNQQYTIFGNAFAEVDIVKGLTARTSFGVDYNYRNRLTFTPVTYEHAENTGVAGQNLQNIVDNNSGGSTGNTWTWTNTLAYSKTLAEVHNFKVLIGSEAISNYTNTVTATRTSANGNVPAYAKEDSDFLTIDAGVGTMTNSGNFSHNSLYSLFARVDYSYADKYLMNATIRRDASSKFGPNNSVGYFPAVAVGWRLTSEEFLKGVSWLNDLKLRASYGIIGNQNGLSNDNRYTTYGQNLNQGYPIAGGNTSFNNSYVVTRVGNPSTQWEKNITTNVGLDATFFNNSFDVTLDVYKKETQGLLVTQQAPYTGATGGNVGNADSPNYPTVNSGNMVNNGIDLGLTKRGDIVEGLRYEVGVTFTRYKNNVTKVLDNPLATITGGGTRLSTPPSITAVGHPVSQYYGFKLDGFFNTQEEVDAFNAKFNPTGTTPIWIPPSVGRWRIKDVNDDGVINDADRTFIGNPHPTFQMGFNLSLAYKNFDLTGFLFWNQGGEIFNYSRYNTDFNTFNYQRSSRMLYDSWTPEHQNALLPKMDLLDTYSNKYPTTYYVESATYVRLKTLQLGYTFPKALLSKIKVDKLRLYVQGQNLFTATKFSGLDPDMSLSGTSETALGIVNNVQPTPRQMLVGLSLGF